MLREFDRRHRVFACFCMNCSVSFLDLQGVWLPNGPLFQKLSISWVTKISKISNLWDHQNPNLGERYSSGLLTKFLLLLNFNMVCLFPPFFWNGISLRPGVRARASDGTNGFTTHVWLKVGDMWQLVMLPRAGKVPLSALKWTTKSCSIHWIWLGSFAWPQGVPPLFVEPFVAPWAEDHPLAVGIACLVEAKPRSIDVTKPQRWMIGENLP